MSIKIIYKGFSQETSAAEGIAILARVFNGDTAKAEEAFITPNFVLRTIGSKAEIGLILPRLEKLGLRCEVVDESQAGSFDDHEVMARMAVCKFCGYEQATAKVCRKCGQSFAAVRKINWKPAVEIQRDEEIEINADEEKSNALMDWFHRSPLFAWRNIAMVVVVLAILVSAGVFKVPGQQTERVTINSGEEGFDEKGNDKATNGIDDDQNGQVDDYRIVSQISTPPKNAVLMLIKGIATADPDEVAKSAVYNPESGENPYANKLKSLGIDQKEFSKTAAGVDGPIAGADVQEIIDNNAVLSGAIDDAVNSSAHSQGGTEADKMIDGIDNTAGASAGSIEDAKTDAATEAIE